MDMANHPVAAGDYSAALSAAPLMFAHIPDLDPEWAERNPERALAFLYVSPRPCEALDRLLTA
jgi:hypothetical protein